MFSRCLAVFLTVLAPTLLRGNSDVRGRVGTIALGQTVAPGTAGELDFGRFYSAAINNSGAVAFTAQLLTDDGSEQSGVWLSDKGQSNLVVRTGMLAPVALEATSFGLISSSSLMLNDVNQVGFQGFLKGPLVLKQAKVCLLNS